MSEFKAAVAEQLNHDRSSLVVDNFHAYARIEQRVRALWDALCLLGEAQLSKENLLYMYAGMASMAQYAAESLHAAQPETQTINPTEESLKLKIEELRSILSHIVGCSQPAKQLQRGQQRFMFEYDLDTLNKLRKEAKP